MHELGFLFGLLNRKGGNKMADPDEYQKALKEAMKYMGQVDTLMKVAIESTKARYKDAVRFSGEIRRGRFRGKKFLTEQMAKAIDWPLKGEWWKE